MATLSASAPASVYADETLNTNNFSIVDAVEALSREERFMGTVHAINTLLIHKGIYSQQEFDAVFCRWAKTQLNRARNKRPGHRSIFSRLFR